MAAACAEGAAANGAAAQGSGADGGAVGGSDAEGARAEDAAALGGGLVESGELLDKVHARLGVPASHIQDLAIAEDGDELRVAVRLGGRESTLVLHPHSLRGPGFEVLVQWEPGGELQPVAPPPVRTYRGVALEWPDSEVRASYAAGGLTAVVYTPQGDYGIQPLRSLGVDQPPGRHAIYADPADPGGSLGPFCAVGAGHADDGGGSLDEGRSGAGPGADGGRPFDAARPEAGHGADGGGAGVAAPPGAARSALGQTLRVADIGLDADFEYLQKFGGSVDDTVLGMEAVINAIEPVYENQLQMTYEITTVIVRAAAGPPYLSSNPSGLLQQFENHWTSPPQDAIQRDTAHLFTGKDLSGETLGIASIGTVCDLNEAYGLSQWVLNFVIRKTITAHEIGHNWGALHCDGSPECRIMCSNAGACDGLVPYAFGPAALAQMLPFMDACPCLGVVGPAAEPPLCEEWPLAGIDPQRWSYVKGAVVTDSAVNEPSGEWSLRLDSAGPSAFQADEIRSHPYDLSGASGTVLSYSVQHRGVEAGEQLVIDYFDDQHRWTELHRVVSDGADQDEFVYYAHVLPHAAHHDQFRVRFRPEVDQPADAWYLDDVSAGCPQIACHAPCSDGDACTAGDACTGLLCAGGPVDCTEAGDDCNTASCDPGGPPENCAALEPANEGGPCAEATGICRNGVCLPTRLFMTLPDGEQAAPAYGPTSLILGNGQTATIEVWVARTQPAALGAFQLALPGAAIPQAGASGTVQYVDTAAGSVQVDASNPDWVFAVDPTVGPYYSETGLPQGFAMLAALPLGSGVPVEDMAYLGEFQIAASADALGLFELPFLPLKAPPNGGTALLDHTQLGPIDVQAQPLEITVVPTECGGQAADCADLDRDQIRDDACTWWACASPLCHETEIMFGDAGGSFGSCPPDGFVNLFDRNHVLACFAGTTPCAPINLDPGGAFGSCAPDGFCNLFDANHVLTAFAGLNPCTCPPGPSPAPSGAGPAAEARLSLEAQPHRIRPGDLAEVRVFIDGPIERLQGYQLHLSPGGGLRGGLDLAGIRIEPRPDFVFAAAAGLFHAANLERGQMLAGLETDTMDTTGPAYLATFTYRASAGAAGVFVIDLAMEESGGQTFLVSDFVERIQVAGSRPALITVEPAPRRARGDTQ